MIRSLSSSLSISPSRSHLHRPFYLSLPLPGAHDDHSNTAKSAQQPPEARRAFIFLLAPPDASPAPGFASEQQSMSADVIRNAYQATEEGFFSLVPKQWPKKPQIAAVGSCCLVGVICGVTLYVPNVGDSRAVLSRLVKATGEVLAIQLF